ncbi:MAG TPA: hypothetical protein VFW94_24325 [Candidatus Acidoferrales bacterium]|nr:hypothetical protein [Candidatus Acidoferrales bacterium]
MAGTYGWLQFVTARQQLASRLADPNHAFWADAENGLYIGLALRAFNAMTYTWRADFTYNSNSLWNSLAKLPGSPRLRTLTDTYCYTLMQYFLLEPVSGGTWTGTSQFSISDFAQALQRRRDEVLKISNCNQSLMPGIAVSPNARKTVLPDAVIDVQRVRFLPLIGGPVVLDRDDTVASEFYESPLYQIPPGTPNTFGLSSEPPLSWTVDIPPSQGGTYEAVVLQSGAAFNPPASTLLGIPDDFAWVLIWGALADLLGRESEATDRARADYCMKRYMDGIKVLLKTPWIELGKVQGAAVSVDSIYAADRYMPAWDASPQTFGPCIVSGGIDFLAAPVNSGIGVTCLGNAPIPVADSDYVQVSRDNWDSVLDLAQFFATFKQGGLDWRQALDLESRAIQAFAAENSRLKSMGCFSDILVDRGRAQDRDVERYATSSRKE